VTPDHLKAHGLRLLELNLLVACQPSLPPSGDLFFPSFFIFEPHTPASFSEGIMDELETQDALKEKKY
jgi:hypothetical protein